MNTRPNPIAILLYGGAYLTINALVTGKIDWSHSVTISRASSPLTFWFLIICFMTVIVFGTRFAVQNREAIWGDGDVLRRKIFLCIGLLVFLLPVYASFLFKYYAGPVVPEPLANLGLFLTPRVISALPFAVLAYVGQNWTPNDAAPPCAVAWVAACAALVHQHPMCAFGLDAMFLPFVVAALLAHGLGTLCRSLKQRAQSISI
jgi:hypothetical protein